MKALVVGISVMVLMTGCAGGIKADGSSPSVTYTVPRSYQTVFLRLQNQADECLRAKNQYQVYANINPALESGSVSVKGPIGALEVARTDFKAIDKSHTQVTHTVWGIKPWDGSALQAMRQSVLMDSSVCVAYK